MTVSIDYIPKIQARKILTYAKILDILKHGAEQVITTEANVEIGGNRGN
jgi:hypothetical protein